MARPRSGFSNSRERTFATGSYGSRMDRMRLVTLC